MDYSKIKAHPTRYGDTLFRSRLEARYAAYFDLCGFGWEYEPVDFKGWTPDFRVSVPCSHSECTWTPDGERPAEHVWWVEIKPYERESEFKSHAFRRFNKPYEFAAIGLGLNPLVETVAEFAHGAGGGEERLSYWIRPVGWMSRMSVEELWAEAGG